MSEKDASRPPKTDRPYRWLGGPADEVPQPAEPPPWIADDNVGTFAYREQFEPAIDQPLHAHSSAAPAEESPSAGHLSRREMNPLCVGG